MQYKPGSPVRTGFSNPRQVPLFPADGKNMKPSGDIQVFLDKDELSASIMVPRAEKTTRGELEELLRSHGVVRGFIPSVLERLASGHDRGKPVEAARGTHPVNGRDARVEYLVNQECRAQLDERERLDFYNLGYVKNIRRDETVAILHPATRGVPGATVTGRKIPQQPGNPHPEFNLLAGDGIALQENAFVALRDGVYHVDHNGTISLLKEVVIPGNVDFSCGNIDSLVDVTIRGDVLSGFSVRSAGSVEILGTVEDAAVEAAGDITIHQGITAGEKPVSAGGLLKARYITLRRHIQAQRILVSGTIELSTVFAGELIACERFIGGTAHCRRLLRTTELGSIMNTATQVILGEDPLLRLERESLEKRLRNNRKQMERHELLLQKLQGEIEQLEKHLDKISTAGGAPGVAGRLRERLLQKRNEHQIRSDKRERLHEREEELKEELSLLTPGTDLMEARAEILRRLHANVSVAFAGSAPREFNQEQGPTLLSLENGILEAASLPPELQKGGPLRLE